MGIDPSAVVAGWIPLLLVLLLAGVSVLLFFSMRKQMRRIDIPEEGIDTHPGRADSKRSDHHERAEQR